MPDQEFLASFGVEIDEGGVNRLQAVLASNRALAEELSAAFEGAAASVRAFLREASRVLPSLSGAGYGVTSETAFGGGLRLGLDLTLADRDLKRFIETAEKPVTLSAYTGNLVSAARSARESIAGILSAPVTLYARVLASSSPVGAGDAARQRMSSGGRFTRPTDVQVAEDGDAEYIIPVKKEARAVPLLKQLLGELSPAARESLAGASAAVPSVGLAAALPAAASVTQDNRTVSAPVTINVRAAGSSGKEIGESLYDTAERYLLRTLQGAME